MDCASFERTLTELLGEQLEAAERDRRLDALRAHVAGCESCRGSSDLLELAACPAGERDPVSDPGPAYWEGFEGRVRARVEREQAVGRRGPRWIAAAAALIVVVLGGWLLLRPQDEAPRIAESPGRPGPSAATGPAEPVAFPEALERQLADADAELIAEADALAGWGGDWAGPEAEGGSWSAGAAFPDVSDLDSETRRELLRWLKEQAS